MAVAARIYLLVGMLAIAAYGVLGGSGYAYEAFGQAMWIAVVIGIARNRPPSCGWHLIAGYAVLLAAGDVFYFSLGGAARFPSFADFAYMAGDVLLIFALRALVKSRQTRMSELLSLVDTCVLSLGIALVLWSVFMSGGHGYGAGLGRAVSISHTTLDLLILVMVARVFLAQGRRTSSLGLLLAAATLLVVWDSSYVVPALTNSYVPGTWRDIGWLASYVLCGTAALDPTMGVLVERRRDVMPIWRVVVLGSSLVLVAVAAIGEQLVRGTVDIYAFGVVSGLMAVFITVRVVALVVQLERTRVRAQESERRFRMVFERAPIGISVGRDGRMSETNPALHKMLGYSADELARFHYTDVTYPDDQDLAVQNALDAGERDSFIVDKRYRRKDGTVLDAHVHVALDVEDGLGISLIEDVSTQIQLEEQLRQSQKMEAVGKLAGGIAHDFNNLMTAVLGYSDLLLNRLEPGDVNREKIEAIRESAVRASDLTRQLLAFGRRQMLRTQDVDLRDAVARMESLLGQLIGADVRLVASYGDEPAIVRADPTQLEQVVMNLVVNARDAMPRGGTLWISVSTEEGAATLTVADNGAGMDEATRARIFEPFFTTKAVGEGSGLGLSTVHGIVGQSGGTIEVQTAPGEGTAFTIRLPRVPLPLVPDAATLVD